MAPKKVSKRPAAKHDDEKPPKNVKKQDKPEEEEEDSSKRDKGKGEKWAKMREKGQLPEHLMQLFDQVPPGVGAREHRTSVINRCFKKNKNGGYEINTAEPMFKQSLAAFDKKYARTEEEGLPESVFLHKNFHGDRAAMKQAYENGDIFQTKDGKGATFWAYTKVTIGRESGCVEKSQLDREKTLSQGDATDLQAMMSSMNWGWNKCKNDALKDGIMSDATKKMLKTAKDSQSRLATEAMKLVTQHGKILHQDRVKELQTGHVRAQSSALAIEHLLKFNMLPNDEELTKQGLETYMGLVAKQTQNVNELVEVSKGLVRAAKTKPGKEGKE